MFAKVPTAMFARLLARSSASAASSSRTPQRLVRPASTASRDLNKFFVSSHRGSSTSKSTVTSWTYDCGILRQEWEIFRKTGAAMLSEPTTCKSSIQSAQPYIESKPKLNPDAKPFHPAPIQSTTRESSLQPDIETKCTTTKPKMNPEAKPFVPAALLESTEGNISLQPHIKTKYTTTKLFPNPDATPFDPAALLESTACSSTLNPLAEIFVPKGATKTGVKRVRFSDEIDVIMINKAPMDTTLPVIQARLLARSSASAASSSRTPQRLVRPASTASRDLNKFYVSSHRGSSTSKSTVTSWTYDCGILRQEWEIFRKTGAAVLSEPTTCKSSIQSAQPYIESKPKLNQSPITATTSVIKGFQKHVNRLRQAVPASSRSSRQ